MTKEEALSLFRKHDDHKRWEHPENFDYDTAYARFRYFASILDTAVGRSHEVETETAIQDVSFHSQILLGPGALRFSNFGNMVSITPDHEVDETTLSIVRQLCLENGYIYVPTEFTELPYTGVSPVETAIPNWWIRYFDWL